jgi:hypothetical protein
MADLPIETTNIKEQLKALDNRNQLIRGCL